MTQSFSVTAGVNTITFPALANTPFTSPPPTPAATASSGLPVSYASTTTGVCTIAGSTISFVSAGTCSITASQAGNATYAPATPVTQSFSVTAGVNTITFPALANTPFTSPPPTPAATASSGLPVSYASTTTGVCTIAGSTISFVSVGTCSITASQAGNATYAPATPVTQSFSVTAGVNTITFPALANTPFTSPPPTPAATASSGLPVSYASTTTGVCTIAGSTISFVAAGTCSITASQAGNANYAPATPVTRTFNVTKGVNTITFPALANTPFTSPPPTPAATASSGLPVSYASTTTGVCTIAGSTISFVKAGTCSITASQAGNANYAAATPVTRSFRITKSANVITFGSLPNRALGSGTFNLTATASSGLSVEYASPTTQTCNVADATVTLLAAGQCTIVASQPGNVDYAAAKPVSQSFSITKASTSVRLVSSSSSELFHAPFTFTATVSGASPTGKVTFRDGGTVLGVVALNGSFQAILTVSTLSVGGHSIIAAYSGNSSNQASVSGAVAVAITRPNPANDPDVRGLVAAQANTEVQFAQTQIDNVVQRLESLHNNDSPCFTNGIGFVNSATQASSGVSGLSSTLHPMLGDPGVVATDKAPHDKAPVRVRRIQRACIRRLDGGHGRFRFGQSSGFATVAGQPVHHVGRDRRPRRAHISRSQGRLCDWLRRQLHQHWNGRNVEQRQQH